MTDRTAARWPRPNSTLAWFIPGGGGGGALVVASFFGHFVPFGQWLHRCFPFQEQPHCVCMTACDEPMLLVSEPPEWGRCGYTTCYGIYLRPCMASTLLGILQCTWVAWVTVL